MDGTATAAIPASVVSSIAAAAPTSRDGPAARTVPRAYGTFTDSSLSHLGDELPAAAPARSTDPQDVTWKVLRGDGV